MVDSTEAAVMVGLNKIFTNNQSLIEPIKTALEKAHQSKQDIILYTSQENLNQVTRCIQDTANLFAAIEKVEFPNTETGENVKKIEENNKRSDTQNIQKLQDDWIQCAGKALDLVDKLGENTFKAIANTFTTQNKVSFTSMNLGQKKQLYMSVCKENVLRKMGILLQENKNNLKRKEIKDLVSEIDFLLQKMVFMNNVGNKETQVQDLVLIKGLEIIPGVDEQHMTNIKEYAGKALQILSKNLSFNDSQENLNNFNELIDHLTNLFEEIEKIQFPKMESDSTSLFSTNVVKDTQYS